MEISRYDVLPSTSIKQLLRQTPREVLQKHSYLHKAFMHLWLKLYGG